MNVDCKSDKIKTTHIDKVVIRMIKRERYMQQIRPFIGNELIKVLTGLRRSGKSVMLELIQEELRNKGISNEQFITFNFESLANAEFCTAQTLYTELKRRVERIQGKAYCFFDEIQEVEAWEKCINSARVDFDCDIYITGSNAKLLSGELATYLGGRYIEFVIYPFSFSEYLDCIKQEGGDADVVKGFSDYLTNPHGNRVASLQYLSDVYNSVILKDVVMRNKIRDVDLLERITHYVMANVGHTFSAKSISNYFKSENRRVAPETVLNYIRACTDAYLFNKVSRQDLKGKRILSVNEKYYLADHGFREAVLGGNTRDIEQVLENIVFMELLRRGYDVTIGKEGDKEIDFVCDKAGERIYIQVCYLLASRDTIDREFGAYNKVADNYPKYVISMDDFDFGRNGIKHMNIREFLLAEHW